MSLIIPTDGFNKIDVTCNRVRNKLGNINIHLAEQFELVRSVTFYIFSIKGRLSATAITANTIFIKIKLMVYDIRDYAE